MLRFTTQDLYGSAAPNGAAEALDTEVAPPAFHHETPAGDKAQGGLEEAKGGDSAHSDGQDKITLPSTVYGDGGLSGVQQLGLLGSMVAVMVLYIRRRRAIAQAREFNDKVTA